MSVNVKKNGKIIKVAGTVDLSVLNYIAQAKVETEASASAAATSAQSAEIDAALSKSYAVGTGGEVRPDDATENAKRYWEQTKEISESFAGTLRPKGTIAFSELPPVSAAEPGDMYNISDEFVTTSDFKEGAGLTIPLGSNIYLTVSRKWDVLAGSPVTSVNGMRGNVSITPENIGAVNNLYVAKALSTPGWKEIVMSNGSFGSIILQVGRMYSNNPAESAMFSICFATDMASNTCVAKIVQLNGCQQNYLIDKIGLAYDITSKKTIIFLHYAGIAANTVYVNVHNSVNDGTIEMLDFIEANPGSFVTEFNALLNVGLVADKALTVDPQVFAKYPITKIYLASSNEAIDAAINDAFNNTSNEGYFEFVIQVGAGELELGGGNWFCQGCKADDNWGYIECKTYLPGYAKKMIFRNNGSWVWMDQSFVKHNITNIGKSSTNAEAVNFLNSIHINAKNKSYYEAALDVIASDGFELGGGTWYVSGFRTTEEYGYQEIKRYANVGIAYYARSRNNSAWTAWKNMVPA